MKIVLAVSLVLLGLVGRGAAAVKHEVIEYKHGDAVLEGYLAWDDAQTAKRPAVLLAPDWMGVSDYARGRADQLAELGYVAFALDMYGKGIRPKNSDEASAQAGIYYKDRALMRARAAAGLAVLQGNSKVDTSKIAVIGYCFGGGVALELARSGAPLKGVVSFHGSLGTPTPEDAKNIKGSVLVLHGADDPFVPADQVKAFEDEMNKAHVDWQFVAYSGAVHSFTKPESGNDPSTGAAYNAKADRRSWQAMKDFFAEILK